MKLKRGVFHFQKDISILGFAAVAGEMEAKGPLKGKFDEIFKGNLFGEKSYEKAESKMQASAVKKAMEKADVLPKAVDAIFAGDILNQCISTNYGLRELKIPFLGLYGACSTMAESILMASIFLDSGHVKITVSVTSSHYCAAERQFRFPLEYGGQRPLTSQWTATAAGAVVLQSDKPKNIFVKAAVAGKIMDYGIKDINNMGAAMAPAAADTIERFFKETKTTSTDYDLILTGDLGAVGSTLLCQLMDKKGMPLKGRHSDCGLMLYDKTQQDVHSGGSGPGCSAAVLCSDILEKLNNKEFKKVIFVATGALMSTTTSQQGETIPAVAHLIYFERT